MLGRQKVRINKIDKINKINEDTTAKLDKMLELYRKIIESSTTLQTWAENFLLYRKIIHDVYTAHAHTLKYPLGFEKASFALFQQKIGQKLDNVMSINDFDLILQIFQLTNDTPLTEEKISSYERDIKQFESNNSIILNVVKDAKENLKNLRELFEQFNHLHSQLIDAITQQIDDKLIKTSRLLAKRSLNQLKIRLVESNTDNLIRFFTNEHLRSEVPEITQIHGIELLADLNKKNDITEANVTNLETLYTLSKEVPISVFDSSLTTEQVIKCLIQSLQLETHFENLKHSSILHTLTRSEKTSSSQEELVPLENKSTSTICITPLTVSIESPVGTPRQEPGKTHKSEKKSNTKRSHYHNHKYRRRTSGSTNKSANNNSSTKEVINNLLSPSSPSSSSIQKDKPYSSSSEDEDNNKSNKQNEKKTATSQFPNSSGQDKSYEKQSSSEYKSKTWAHFQPSKHNPSNSKYKTLTTPLSSPKKNNH